MLEFLLLSIKTLYYYVSFHQGNSKLWILQCGKKYPWWIFLC